MLKLRTTAGVFLLTAFTGACVVSDFRCELSNATWEPPDPACHYDDMRPSHGGAENGGPTNGTNGGGNDGPGNPGNDKSVGNAGEKADKGGFGAPSEGGTGTRGRGDKDGRGNPGKGQR